MLCLMLALSTAPWRGSFRLTVQQAVDDGPGLLVRSGFTNTYSTCRCKVSESPKRGGVLNEPSAGERSVLPTFNQELTALRPRPFRITARAKPNAPTNSRVLVLASGTAAAGVTVKIPRPASLLSVRTPY